MFADPHDPRMFSRFAKCDAEGNVVAMVEVAAGAPAPDDTDQCIHVNISDHGKVDLADPKVLTAVRKAHALRDKKAHGR